MKEKKSDSVSYLMNRGSNKPPIDKTRIPNRQIDLYLNKELGFEGFHTICHICIEPLITEWHVVRNTLRICQHCSRKKTDIETKTTEYKEMGFL